MIGGVEHFVDDDSAYLGWVAEHPSGYVINTGRTPSAAYLMLHRADCRTITGIPPRGSTFTRDYSKVCGSQEELKELADNLGGDLKRCGICIARRATPATRGPSRSKYLPLREYLAGREGNEVQMSFAEIEELVGHLPPSARLHRAWWSNSSHIARAWKEAGWHLRSINQSAEHLVFVHGTNGALSVGGNDANTSQASYVDAQVIAAIKVHNRPERFDRAKLLRLIDELNDNYARGSIYAVHAVLRALLDHIPPLLGHSNFTAVVNNYPWGRTDKAYMRRLLDFRLQADDVLHRQISTRTDFLSLHDIPPRACVNRLLQECLSQSEAAELNALISSRESTYLEFKQTMRWDARLHKRNQELLKACVKTVCAFLNGEGGTLLIGVSDSGEPIGLEDDLRDLARHKTVDVLERQFRGALIVTLDPEVSHLVTISFPLVHGIQICRVDVKRSSHPIFLVSKGSPAQFYVRNGNISRPLDVRQAYEYIREHWR